MSRKNANRSRILFHFMKKGGLTHDNKRNLKESKKHMLCYDT